MIFIYLRMPTQVRLESMRRAAVSKFPAPHYLRPSNGLLRFLRVVHELINELINLILTIITVVSFNNDFIIIIHSNVQCRARLCVVASRRQLKVGLKMLPHSTAVARPSLTPARDDDDLRRLRRYRRLRRR